MQLCIIKQEVRTMIMQEILMVLLAGVCVWIAYTQDKNAKQKQEEFIGKVLSQAFTADYENDVGLYLKIYTLKDGQRLSKKTTMDILKFLKENKFFGIAIYWTFVLDSSPKIYKVDSSFSLDAMKQFLASKDGSISSLKIFCT